jgi:hypothetical protein
MTQPKPPRTPTRDRDVYVAKTPGRGVPDFVPDEVTGQYEGEDLARMRAKRPTDKRIEKLEAKHDSLDGKVDDIGNRMARMEGKLDTALSVLVPERQQVHATERHKVDSRTKVILAIVGGIGTLVGLIVSAIARSA